MTAQFTRDAAATALVFGFFASSWLSWAQVPAGGWQNTLMVLAILSLLIAVLGAFFTWRHRSDGTAFGPQTGRTFGIIVGIEFALAAIGAGVLSAVGQPAFVPAWVALVVGVHLFPLAPLLKYPLLYVPAALVTVIALAAIPLASALAVPVSAVVGIATGVVLLASALFSLITVVF